jgi:hypothetical protein
MAFTKNTDDMNIIQKLDDEPNDVGGLTATQLKAKFDEGGINLQDFINDHIDELESASAAGNIGFQTSAAVPASNIQAAIENVQSQVAEATTGEIANASITNVKLAAGSAAGWEDITNSVDLELVTQAGGAVQSISLESAIFRYSRTLGIVAFKFILSGEITREKEIDLQHTAYNCDSFGGMAICTTQHGSKCGVELFYASGHTTHRVHLWEAHTGGIIVSGWYFCDGE